MDQISFIDLKPIKIVLSLVTVSNNIVPYANGVKYWFSCHGIESTDNTHEMLSTLL